jgi:thiamine-phosphate pyrophosphorylase
MAKAPVLCLVTDRRRLIAAVAAPGTLWRPLLVSQITGAIAGGVDVVQIREPDLESGALAALVRDSLAAAAGTPVRIVVNDRLDVALATAAHGVHLRGDSLPPAAARRIAPPGFEIGRSIHDAADAAAVGAVEYLIAGSVFATASKPQAPARLGLDGLADVVAAGAASPVWAIGGITAERIPEVLAAGARGIAAIGAFVPRVKQSDLQSAVCHLTTTLRSALDVESNGLQGRANPR